MAQTQKLSTQLQNLFHDHKKIKINNLNNLVGEKSFAFAFLLLMLPAALPLPTGGFTHFFEILTMLLALELIYGRKNIWLPKRWQNASINSPKPGKGLNRLTKFIAWLEKFSRPRGVSIHNNSFWLRISGCVVVVFAAAAFLAPPFSGLDTLPALGIVVLCLGMMLDDFFVYIFGIVVGVAGILVVILLSQIILSWGQHTFFK